MVADNLNDFGLLTLAAVAELLHCSKSHVSNVVAGRVEGCVPIPVIRLGRRMLVRRESLVNWINENEANRIWHRQNGVPGRRNHASSTASNGRVA